MIVTNRTELIVFFFISGKDGVVVEMPRKLSYKANFPRFHALLRTVILGLKGYDHPATEAAVDKALQNFFYNTRDRSKMLQGKARVRPGNSTETTPKSKDDGLMGDFMDALLGRSPAEGRNGAPTTPITPSGQPGSGRPGGSRAFSRPAQLAPSSLANKFSAASTWGAGGAGSSAGMMPHDSELCFGPMGPHAIPVSPQEHVRPEDEDEALALEINP